MRMEFKSSSDYWGNNRISKRRAKRRFERLPNNLREQFEPRPGFKVSYDGDQLVTIEIGVYGHTSRIEVYSLVNPFFIDVMDEETGEITVQDIGPCWNLDRWINDRTNLHFTSSELMEYYKASK